MKSPAKSLAAALHLLEKTLARLVKKAICLLRALLRRFHLPESTGLTQCRVSAFFRSNRLARSQENAQNQ